MFRSKIARIAARAFFVAVHCEDRSANRNGAGRSRTSCAHVAEYRQRDLLFPSSESKTIPFRRMDLPMSSLSEDKRAGHGNTLEKEEKTVRRCRNDTGPI